MADKSKIEWTEATWNPIRGCTRVSQGCVNCYAERVAMRFGGKGQPYEGLVQMTNGHPQWTGKVQFVEKHLADPLKWKEPRRIFANSMSDLFHKGVSDGQINQIFAVMALCPQHTFQVLTKRPERMLEQVTRLSKSIAPLEQAARELGYTFKFTAFNGEELSILKWPIPNVWLGVSCENQETADERIPLLLQTRAAVRWVSAEPLIGPIDLSKIEYLKHGSALTGIYGSKNNGGPFCTDNFINWVVVGGESGPNARPMHPDWARSLRDQCQAAVVPFFFKQWGEFEPSFDFPKQFEGINPKTQCLQLAADGHIGHSQAEMEGHSRHGLMVRTGKKAAGRLLDGREWNEYPESLGSRER